MWDEDYIAIHCRKDRLTFLGMTVASGLLAGFFLSQPGNWLVTVFLAGIFCFSAVWTYVFFVSSVRFARDQIQVRVPPFVDYSKNYTEIEGLQAQRGMLKVRFASGKLLRLPAGLGKADTIASLLEYKTDLTVPKPERRRR